MDTTSAGSDQSLGVPGVHWDGRMAKPPLRVLLAVIVVCQPASVLLVVAGLWPWGLALLTLSHATLLAGIFLPWLSWFGPTHTRLPAAARGEEAGVWLTIDDGPDPRTTPAILEVLGRFGARATFFVIGERARRHPELLARIVAEGHQLGNHSMHHPVGTFWCLHPARVRREIEETNDVIRRVTGTSPPWFRPPVGHQNPFLHPIAARHGLGVVTWSATGWDGISVPFEQAFQRIRRRSSAGAILVVHEGYDPVSRGYAPAALVERILEHLRTRGYETRVPTSRLD
jgi:peptidoglycan-N-acetylglucosamine deacetylase